MCNIHRNKFSSKWFYFWWKNHFLMLAHLSGTVCLKNSATLIFLPLSKPSSKPVCSESIIKLSTFVTEFTPAFQKWCVWGWGGGGGSLCASMCLSVTSVIKNNVLHSNCMLKTRCYTNFPFFKLLFTLLYCIYQLTVKAMPSHLWKCTHSIQVQLF